MTTIQDIKLIVKRYLDDEIIGEELVNVIDSIVSSDIVYSFEQPYQDIILEYQDLFSMFVGNLDERLEYIGYFGPEKLKDLAENLYHKL